MLYNVPEKLKKLSSIFSRNGYSLYLVGGAVRDYLLGRENHDYDFTTDAQPMEVKTMFRKTIDTGIKHGTVTVLFGGESYEITTFRTEGDYGDSRHPDSVEFVRNLDEDLKRRDFTINALAADLVTGEIIDQHGGISDLEKGLIKAIGIPEERFREDALRMLRGCRFSAKLGFSIDGPTMDAMKALSSSITKVSAERIREELWGIIKSPEPRVGLEAMRESGIMELVLPELYATVGEEQDGYHNETVYEHSILALEHAERNNYPMPVKVAALFHDLGKVSTKRMGDGHYTYYSHEIVGEKIAKAIMTRLKASNEERDAVMLLVREHMFQYTPDWSDGAVRRFITRVGEKSIPLLFMLRECDNAATTGNLPLDSSHIELGKRIEKELSSNSALTLKDLKINGRDLGEIMPKGPMMGKVLNALLDEVIDDPSLNDHEKLIERAKVLSAKL